MESRPVVALPALLLLLASNCSRSSRREHLPPPERTIARAGEPITATTYVASLGKGLDVDWSKTSSGARSYSERTVVQLKARGISHVRIRVKDDPSPTLLRELDAQIGDCLAHGIKPVLAYQGGSAKEDPTDAMRDSVVRWWREVAEHFARFPYELSFDLIIEVTDALSKDAVRLNDWYSRIYPEVRATNPMRVVFISPRVRSSPDYLHELTLPVSGREFLAAEWHFYASGPTKDHENKVKRWTTGTAEERAMITDKIAAALKWQRETGVPTWVGAWMANDYNVNSSYSIDEQIVFASFVACALEEARVPFALNQENKYYDAETGSFILPDVQVLDVVLQPSHPRRIACAR